MYSPENWAVNVCGMNDKSQKHQLYFSCFCVVTFSLLLTGCLIDAKTCTQKTQVNTQVSFIKMILLDG